LANSQFTLLPFGEAVERLDLPAHFGEHTFDRYDEANLKVRYYEKKGVIEGDVIAKYLIIDDHTTIVGRNVKAAGWKEAANAIAELPDSNWLSEIKSQFKDEFFDSRGEMLCGNGNVDLVKALLAGRDILRAHD
jgi:hypothetical protein